MITFFARPCIAPRAAACDAPSRNHHAAVSPPGWAIAGTANVYPEISLEIYRLWKDGRIEEAILEQARLRPLRDVMKLGNPNSVIKRAMNLLGHPVGPAREPVGGVSPKIDDELRKAFGHYK